MNTPENITQLEPHQIFVFGSNTTGIHGKGAALLAQKKFGAKRGVGEGRTGQCYALPTRMTLPNSFRRGPIFKTLSLDEIACHVSRFLGHAAIHPELEFLVTKIGCGYAGYQPSQIAPMFRGAPENVILPLEFQILLDTPARA